MIHSIRLFMVIAFCAVSFSGYSQKPEPVYSIIRQVHDFDWYEQQAMAWKKEIDNGTTNNMAWVYWFYANRNAERFVDRKKWESKIGDYFVPAEKIIELAERSIPNTFEGYFLKTYSKDLPGINSLTDSFLLRAHEIKPYDELLLPGLLNHYIAKNDKAGIETTCRKWFECNEIPQELLITAYNNLISLDSNAVLIVNGDNDTYPAWVMQYGQKIRPDVLVLNLSMATYSNAYREAVFKEHGFQPIALNADSVGSTARLLKHLVSTVKSRPVYVSIFTGSKEYKEFENKMYFVGLSLKYSEKPFNNTAVLRNNVENKYLTDFLKRSFYNYPSASMVKIINGGYVASFLKLSEYYKQSGEPEKAKRMKDFARTVAQNSGYTQWLKEIDK